MDFSVTVSLSDAVVQGIFVGALVGIVLALIVAAFASIADGMVWGGGGVFKKSFLIGLAIFMPLGATIGGLAAHFHLTWWMLLLGLVGLIGIYALWVWRANSRRKRRGY